MESMTKEIITYLCVTLIRVIHRYVIDRFLFLCNQTRSCYVKQANINYLSIMKRVTTTIIIHVFSFASHIVSIRQIASIKELEQVRMQRIGCEKYLSPPKLVGKDKKGSDK